MRAIIAQLVGELESFAKAARAAHAEATHEQSKAENKYDTRGLEASYLARGQSRQAAELEQAIAKLRALPVREFGDDEPADVGALIELRAKNEKSYYFLLPCAGGTEVSWGGDEILVITPESPLGKQIVGKKKGERFELEIGGTRSEYRVAGLR
jgi:transcription elongation GreA/GreB family factor